MKEYIKDILYNTSGLMIGKSKHSFILQQDEDFIILDKKDIKNISYALTDIQNLKRGGFDGFHMSKNESGINITQGGSSISINRAVFHKYLQCY